ncbi:unnamed protein product [Chrysoparadoxa australica]
MSRHRAFRNRQYSYDEYDDDYDDYDEDEYQEGVLYGANDAPGAAEEQSTAAAAGAPLTGIIAEVDRRLGPSHQYSRAQLSQAVESSGYDVDTALAILLSSDVQGTGAPLATKQGAQPPPPPGFEKKANQVAKGSKQSDQSQQQAQTAAARAGTQKTQKAELKACSRVRRESRGTEPSPAASSMGSASPLRTETAAAIARELAFESARGEDDEGEPDSDTEDKGSEGKERVSMVVIGHVDAGKSTLMGQVLVKVGQVSDRVVRSYAQQAKALGKASFHLAWVLDEDEEERAHGVTIDVAQKHFETASKLFTLLDAPGHKDFIPKMISGASQADVAVLVVPATPGEFESGFAANGQTKEHALLVKALGVNQVLVAINKLDATEPAWSQERYEDIQRELLPFLRQHAGFKPKKIRFVPVSGISGENVADLSKGCPLKQWYSGPTLLEAMDAFTQAPSGSMKPFRMLITDVLPTGRGVIASGKVTQGRVRTGDKVFVMPLGEMAVATKVEVGGERAEVAKGGDSTELLLAGIDLARIFVGDCLCKAKTPLPVVTSFDAQVVTLEALPVPIICGTEFQLHIHSVDVICHCSKLIAVLGPSGEIIKRRPRAIAASATAHVRFTCRRPLCLERYGDCRSLGRFVLRQRGATVAVGLVLELCKQ